MPPSQDVMSRPAAPPSRQRARVALAVWLVQLIGPTLGLAFILGRLRDERELGRYSLTILGLCLAWYAVILLAPCVERVRRWILARPAQLLTLYASSALVLAGVEIFSRARVLARWEAQPAGSSRIAYCPDLGWRLVPGVEDIGEHGWRLPYRAPGLHEGRFRVVCLGDSTTFGHNCPWEGAWPHQLEGLLNHDAEWAQTHGTAEAVNLGVPGYGPDQALLALKKFGLAYQPDLVIFHLCLNDFADASFDHDWRSPDGISRYKPCYALANGRLVLKRDHAPPARDAAGNLYQPGSRRAIGLQAALLLEVGGQLDRRECGLFFLHQNAWPVHEAFRSQYAKARPLVWALVGEMAWVARESGSPFLVMLSPTLMNAPTDRSPWRAGSFLREFEDDANGEGVPFLNPVPEYFAEGGNERFLTHPGGHHLNAEGNALLARAAFRWLKEQYPAARRTVGSPADGR